MWKTLWRAALCGAMLLFASAAGADGDERRTASIRLGGDLFAGGGSVSVREPVAGDLIASGGSVDVDAAVAGDAVALGGRVRVGAGVGQSLYAASGQLTVDGAVGRSARLAGGQVELGPKSEVQGNLSVLGGQVRLRGAVKGHVQAAGGNVLVDGPVGGDVVARVGQLELGPNARVTGKVQVMSREALRQDPAAQVGGGVEQLQLPPGTQKERGAADRHREARRGGGAVVAGLWTAGLIVVAVVVLALLPAFSAGVARTLRERVGTSLLLGFALLVCVPVGVVIVLATVIGIPLALLTLALYAALLPLAYALAGIGLGEWALRRWWPDRAGRLAMRMLAAAGALVVLALLAWVPLVGWLAGLLALLAGLGALLLQTRRAGAGPAV